MSHASTASWVLNLLPTSATSLLLAVFLAVLAWIENLPHAVVLTVFIVVFAIIFMCALAWKGYREQRRPSLLQSLNVRSIQVSFDEMEIRRCIEISISMHNGFGTNLRLGNVLGHVELRPITSMPQWLPSPTLLPTTKDIHPGSDFHLTLLQKFPDEAVKATMSAWDQGRKIQLNLSELEISISGNGKTEVLPLWYGVTIEKIADRYLAAELIAQSACLHGS